MSGIEKTAKQVNDLTPIETTRRGSVSGRPPSIVDPVFGQISEDGPNYRSLGWIQTAVLMMKTQIGLGVLSIPAAFHVLGIIPGVIALLLIGAITTWSDYMVGVFKLNHRDVYGLDDVGYKILGRTGKEVLGNAFTLFWITVAGSGMLGLSIGFNAVSNHGTCTAVFVAVAAAIGMTLASVRTLSRISWLAWIGVVCILIAIFIVTTAVGVQARPAAAPQTGPFDKDFQLVGDPSFTEAVTAISSLIFAFSGTPAFFSIAAEMRDPTQYNKSLLLCQSVVTTVYTIIGCVVYYYCGVYVASPALGSAGGTIKKIAYGFAIPGLIATTVITVHVPAKYLLVRFLRGSKHLADNSKTHWCTWLGCVFGSGIIAYIIASAIPVFGGLVSLIGALLGTLMSFQPMGCMWLYDNWGIPKAERNWRWKFMVCFAVFVIVSGTFMMIAGTYGSVVGIMESYKVSGGSAAWTCADNSNSAGLA